jgi:hypothetical protein
MNEDSLTDVADQQQVNTSFPTTIIPENYGLNHNAGACIHFAESCDVHMALRHLFHVTRNDTTILSTESIDEASAQQIYSTFIPFF